MRSCWAIFLGFAFAGTPVLVVAAPGQGLERPVAIVEQGDAMQGAAWAGPDRAAPLPAELEGVGVNEKLGAMIPLGLQFQDESGRKVTLGQYLGGPRPVVLNLGYFTCPMLCNLVLAGLVDSTEKISFTPGQQYDVLSVSIDPADNPIQARLKKRSIIEQLGRPEAASGWHCLVGKEEEIKALADAVGFGFRWDDRQKQFAHAGVLIVLTPDGKVSRYLYGIQFPAQTLRLSLVEAADGKIGSAMDQILLFCFHYDKDANGYVLTAMNLMRLGGFLTVAVLGGGLAFAFYSEHRLRRRVPAQPPGNLIPLASES